MKYLLMLAVLSLAIPANAGVVKLTYKHIISPVGKFTVQTAPKATVKTVKKVAKTTYKVVY